MAPATARGSLSAAALPSRRLTRWSAIAWRRSGKCAGPMKGRTAWRRSELPISMGNFRCSDLPHWPRYPARTRRTRARLHDSASHGLVHSPPGRDAQTFKDRTVVPVECAIGVQMPDFFIDTELSRHVLNGRLRNLLRRQESTDRLEDLQLHEQRHL